MTDDAIARARSIKAFKLSRVMRETLDRFTVEDIETATAETREIAARIAGTRYPSDETWALMCTMLRVQRR